MYELILGQPGPAVPKPDAPHRGRGPRRQLVPILDAMTDAEFAAFDQRRRASLDQGLHWVATTRSRTGPKGYPQIWLNDDVGMVLTHVATFVIEHGRDVTDGMVLDHYCAAGRACVRHVEEVTHGENIRRAGFYDRIECRNGHLLAGPTVAIRRDGSRRCRLCTAAAARRRRAIDKVGKHNFHGTAVAS